MSGEAGWRMFTREHLVDALACIELRVPAAGPMAGKVNAESMADAIIRALHGQAEAGRQRAAGLAAPLLEATDEVLQEALIEIGQENRRRLRAFLAGAERATGGSA